MTTTERCINRRSTLATLAALSLLGSAPTWARTAYPSQPIKLVVPYPAGGATDTLARLIGQKLQENWNNPVVVENRAGAGGTIGSGFVAKAAPDGHTVLLAITAIIQQPPLMQLTYDLVKDFQPITRVAISPSLLAVQPGDPAKDLKGFIAQVKISPGKYNFGTYGAGTSSHIQGELLNTQAGLDMTQIPFQGAAPLVANMLGGQLTAAFIDSATARPHLKSFKVLAVTGPSRMPALPEVRERIEALGLFPASETPEEFAKVMRSDAEVYARIIKDAKITLK